ncbi:hypothetical protein PC129_g13874 [Phytophthora cactorum]|uniref:Uncharacterized protein n=1 Tax=Phytophthora cactorum TaxID=29920 RepID=A0A8T1HTM9_9STRA|nr:hypothetical protein PC129_g13874 [Phytophthora cactorum]
MSLQSVKSLENGAPRQCRSKLVNGGSCCPSRTMHATEGPAVDLAGASVQQNYPVYEMLVLGAP